LDAILAVKLQKENLKIYIFFVSTLYCKEYNALNAIKSIENGA
jgi:uncharacterized protein YegP (UPF0339 family)